MRTSFAVSAIMLVVALAAVPAQADPLAIIGYDITNATLSGYGYWGHVYTGTITPTVGDLANYSGGTGTMANGIVETNAHQTQLFRSRVNAGITVFLDGAYTLDMVEIFGGDIPSNAIPGAIDAMDLTIGANTVHLPGSPFGALSYLDTPRNDRFVLSGTALDGLMTDRITLSNILDSSCCGGYSIAEIKIYGTEAGPAPIPEPGSVLLLATGLGLLAVAVRRRK